MHKEEIKSRLIPLLRKNGVVKSALFGSLVRGDATEKSDIDLLVQFQKGKSLLDLVGLKQEIEEMFHCNADVVTYGSIHPRLRDSILREQEVFYEETAEEDSRVER